jgi:outer membrane protein OmpA-like peptidoglycan-associated protein
LFDLVVVMAQPIALRLRAPAATPEKVAPGKGDFPYLGALPGAKLHSGAAYDGPLKLPTQSAAGNETVMVGSGWMQKNYDLAGLTTVQFAVVYRAALEAAGWSILAYSQNPHQGDAFISAHYGKDGRDIWTYLHGTENGYSIAVADAGAKDDLAAELTRDCHVALYGVLFDFNKVSLKPESDAVLSRVAKVLGAASALKVEVQGHTDSIGSDDYNLKLSDARAASVMAWLTAHGVAAVRLSAKGYGETRPVASNDTDDGRAKNRRVEIAVPGCGK